MKVWAYCQGNGRDRQSKLKERNQALQVNVRAHSRTGTRPLEKIPRKVKIEKITTKALSLEWKICSSHDNFMA